MVERPNILWICLDQLRWDWLGCTGHPLVRTPHIDRLAADGALCEHGYCQSPVCMPSRASFLSGCHPRTIGLRQNGQGLPEHAYQRLLPVRFQHAGYATACFGKLHLQPVDRRLEAGRDAVPGLAEHAREPLLERAYQHARWDHNGAAAHPGSDFRAWLWARGVDPDAVKEAHPECPHVRIGRADEHHCTSWIASEAGAWIHDQAGRGVPWLASVNIIDPHHPFDPPPECLAAWHQRLDQLPVPTIDEKELALAPPLLRAYHRAAYNEPWFDLDWTRLSDHQHRLMQAAYGAMVEHTDTCIGRILAALEASGQCDNTIVLLHSDHGELLGAHGSYYKGPFCFDASVRTPLIWRWPGRIPAGQRRAALIELSDIAPTLYEACAIDAPPMQGRSLLPLLSDAAHLEKHRKTVHCEYLHDAIPGHGDGPVYTSMHRTRTHKLVHWAGHETGELYLLDQDPQERRNRWHDHDCRALRGELQAALCDHLVGMVDPGERRTGMY